MFKSYYVVWKLENENDENDIGRSLNRTMQYGNPELNCFEIDCNILFKSYYVVWKRQQSETRYAKKHGLNRTMQYGN